MTFSDEQLMERAVAMAAQARRVASPNPWVGAVVQVGDVSIGGSTQLPGGPHAEIMALREAAERTRGATLYCTLEPCDHTGRTGPCTQAIIDAGIARVVVAVEDPDPRVSGRGLARLREAGIEVVVGIGAEAVRTQLAPYLTHRSTGRPYVVLKLAATLDGRTAAPDGTSQWITGFDARVDAHGLRAESDAVLVGAGTVRTDDPSLTVRHTSGRDPLRVVLGQAPAGARVHPCLELSGDLGAVLDKLGGMDIVQLLVEGGASVARAFHAAGLVDRYVVYLAPALMGGDDGAGLFAGAGAATMAAIWRGRLASVTRVGDDVRIDVDRSA